MQLDRSIAAVVTGGASGLGAATVRALSAKGARVAILDIDDTAGKALAAATGAIYQRCDVTSTDSVEQGMAAARAVNGIERVLVTCAGIAIGQRIARRNRNTGNNEPHDQDAFERVIGVNLSGTFRVMSRSAAAMMDLEPLPPDGERGVMITTASVAAEDGQIGQVAYAASKGAVAAMTLPIARDLASQGIRSVTIMPGLFETPMFRSLPDDARKALAASVPFPARLGDPSEYAALAIHICENVMLNGCAIRLDGTIRLPMR